MTQLIIIYGWITQVTKHNKNKKEYCSCYKNNNFCIVYCRFGILALNQIS